MDQTQIDEELRTLEHHLGQTDLALRHTGGVYVDGMRAHSFYIQETLRKLPPGTLHRNNGKCSFTPHPPKPPVVASTRSQHVRSVQLRARLALAEG